MSATMRSKREFQQTGRMDNSGHSGTEGDYHKGMKVDPSYRAASERAVSGRMSRAGAALCVCGD